MRSLPEFLRDREYEKLLFAFIYLAENRKTMKISEVKKELDRLLSKYKEIQDLSTDHMAIEDYLIRELDTCEEI